MKTENHINCYEALDKEIGNLCQWENEIREMERSKGKVLKATIQKEKANYALSKEHFRGMYDMAILTGEFYALTSDTTSLIESRFGWFFE